MHPWTCPVQVKEGTQGLSREGWGCEIKTEAELEQALTRAAREYDRLALIEVHLDPMDCSAALRRLGAELRRQNALEED